MPGASGLKRAFCKKSAQNQRKTRDLRVLNARRAIPAPLDKPPELR
jgi:hypothetical protein|nr:MAG TPA: hypothetical protein [Caudoviricetes sp.]